MTDTPQENSDLTLKQRKWLDFYLKDGNATQAVIDAGYDVNSRESAAQIGYENLRKLDYEDFLEAAGITDNLLQLKILQGLDAKKTVSAKVIKGKNEPAEADESTDDFIDVPDYTTRHKYLETALKLKKRLVFLVDHTTKGEKLPAPIYGGKSTEE